MGTGQACQTGKQRLVPHVGILARSKAIEKPAVDYSFCCRIGHQGQGLLDIAKPQIQHDCPTGQQQTVAAKEGIRIVGHQLGGKFGQLRPAGQRLGQIGAGQGYFQS